MLSLPDELIVYIGETLYVEPDISLLPACRSLAFGPIGALATSCHRIRRIVWPLTFRRVRITTESIESGVLTADGLKDAR